MEVNAPWLARRFHPAWLLLTLLLSGQLAAAPLTFCFEDVPQQPWTMPDKSGLNFVLLEKVAARLGERFEYAPRSWKRCMAETQSGQLDGVIGASITDERKTFGVFPSLPGGAEDVEGRLYYDDFDLYVLRNSAASWDGKRISNQTGAVAVPAGYRVGITLRRMGFMVDEDSKSAEDIMRRMSSGTLSAAVLQGYEARQLLQGQARFAQSIKRLSPTFERMSLHLLVSRRTYERDPARIEAIWKAIRQVRDSAEYQKQERARLAGE